MTQPFTIAITAVDRALAGAKEVSESITASEQVAAQLRVDHSGPFGPNV